MCLKKYVGIEMSQKCRKSFDSGIGIPRCHRLCKQPHGLVHECSIRDFHAIGPVFKNVCDNLVNRILETDYEEPEEGDNARPVLKRNRGKERWKL